MGLLRRWYFSKILKQAHEKALRIPIEYILCRSSRKSKGLRWSRYKCLKSSRKATVAEAESTGTWHERPAERQAGFMGSSLR